MEGRVKGRVHKKKSSGGKRKGEGCDTDMDLKAEFDLDEDVVQKVVGKEKYNKEAIAGSNDADGRGE